MRRKIAGALIIAGLLAASVMASRANTMFFFFVGSGGSGGGGGGCDGTIDLSTGCVQPMFGGL